MKNISCIIPAYNEEKSIGKILEVLVSISKKFICEIIVINDFSTDKTKNIVEGFSQVKLLNNTKNLGKSKSVAKGIEVSKGNYIFLLDADILNLKDNNIKQIISPILNNETDVVFGFIKNAWPLFPFKKIDFCTGERVIEKGVLLEEISKIKQLPSYGLEVFINNLIIKNRLKLKVVYLLNVENDFHQNKDGFIKGWMKNFRIWYHIIKISGGFINIYLMNFRLRKLLVD